MIYCFSNFIPVCVWCFIQTSASGCRSPFKLQMYSEIIPFNQECFQCAVCAELVNWMFGTFSNYSFIKHISAVFAKNRGRIYAISIPTTPWLCQRCDTQFSDPFLGVTHHSFLSGKVNPWRCETTIFVCINGFEWRWRWFFVWHVAKALIWVTGTRWLPLTLQSISRS